MSGENFPKAGGRIEIAGVILASGLSARFGTRNKLVQAIDGESVLRRTVSAYVDGNLRPVIVVVGYEADRVAASLSNLPVEIVPNPGFAEGQSRALLRGVEALPDDAAAAIIGVGDQPFLSSSVIRLLVSAYFSNRPPLVIPRYQGRRGNPALFDRSLFKELLAVSGDQGGRPVVVAHEHAAAWIDIPDEYAGLDIDTRDDLRRVTSRE